MVTTYSYEYFELAGCYGYCIVLLGQSIEQCH